MRDIIPGLWKQKSQKELTSYFLKVLSGEKVFFSAPGEKLLYQEFPLSEEESLFVSQEFLLSQSDCRDFVLAFCREYTWWERLQETQDLLLIDDLTGLYNYRYLESFIEKEIRRSARYKKKFSILFIDIDHFKSINDQHGHLMGSLVLKQLAHILKSELRDIDSLIRYGGDEFVGILLESTSKQGFAVGERLRSLVARSSFGTQEHPLRLSLSIGVATYPDHGKNPDELLHLADESMYRSKKDGRDQVCLAALKV
jgi:diguanylate cyclase (GGDEF)-like protein